MQGAINKVSKLLYEANIRIVYIPKKKNKESAIVKLREIAGSFKQFNIPQINGLEIGRAFEGEKIISRYQNRTVRSPFLFSTEELATVYHLPNLTVTTPNIYWVRSKLLEPPGDLPTPSNTKEDDLTLIGRTNFRGSLQTFGIKTLDRRRHMYIIGKTGMGKSTLLENMIYSDIAAGKGVAVVDPHGDLADNVLNFIPSWRTNHVVIFDPSDREFPVAFNMLENVDPSLNSIISSGLVGIFKKIYAESWGPRLEHILRNTILSLLEYPGTTMLGIPRILQDKEFRKKVVRKITDPIVKSFWENEFEKMEPRQRVEAISPILNKVGQFLSSPIIRNILGQPKSAIDLRFAMDKKKIVIVNLSKGKIGEDNSSLLGAMMITKFQLDAMTRANIPEKDREDFYLYVDEFQNFATDSFATILSEARKYRLNLTMANQYIAQMKDEVKDAVFGNVGSILGFQVGYDDADYLSQQFGEEVLPPDMVSLSKYSAYTKLLIDGMPSKTFSLNTLPPPILDEDIEGRRDKVIKLARERYATDRAVVEDKIKRWSENSKQLDSGKK
ncbi:type IV secretion system DNA-binding domain-containing protein [Candidatus Peregrinibacteria bacterium]|nr:type IV secretion system DNA-binding domain-containing protein [Candidatus Peregrinibacteria bacterium]